MNHRITFKSIYKTIVNPICSGQAFIGSIMITALYLINYLERGSDIFLDFHKYLVLIFLMILLPFLGFYPIINNLINFKKWYKRFLLFYVLPFSFFWSSVSIYALNFKVIGALGFIFGLISFLGVTELNRIYSAYFIFLIAFFLSSILSRSIQFNKDALILILEHLIIFFGVFAISKVNSYIKSLNKKMSLLLVKSRKDKRLVIEERNKSEKLLLNILPEEVASELKSFNYSKPKKYDNVTVMFTDFVGFTSIAETLNAEELIQELDNCFSYFDSQTKKNKLEKIKTIGDSYMTCAGLPHKNNTHAIDTILAALEIKAFLDQAKEIKKSQNLPYWELRIGIHSGPLIAGVIGEMKFSYDVFGDTVNLASRMESSGEKGEINISYSTYMLIKDFFICESRGKVKAKNKGEIEMFFVKRLKPELSVDGEGKVPNNLFRKEYQNLL